MWTDSARRQYQRSGPRNASDLTDAEFALIEPLLPLAKRCGWRRTASLREVLKAILHLLGTGCPSAAGWPRLLRRSYRLPLGYRLANAGRRVPAALDRLRLEPPWGFPEAGLFESYARRRQDECIRKVAGTAILDAAAINRPAIRWYRHGRRCQTLSDCLPDVSELR